MRAVYHREKLQLEGEQPLPVSVRGEETVLELLVRLDFDPTEALTDLEKLIFEGHIRLSSETIRQLFAGLGSRKGLLQVALSDDDTDELIRFKALKLANRLLSYEENRDADNYHRAFANCPLRMFKVPTACLHQSSQLRINLFRLLRSYLRSCPDQSEVMMHQALNDASLEQ